MNRATELPHAIAEADIAMRVHQRATAHLRLAVIDLNTAAAFHLQLRAECRKARIAAVRAVKRVQTLKNKGAQ